MSNFEILFDRPWLLLLLIPAFAIVLIPFLRITAKRRKTPKRIIPVVLHMVICTLLVLALSGISFIVGEDTQSVMILLDLSDSTETRQSEMIAFANQMTERLDENCGVLAFGGNTVYEVTLDDENKTVASSSVVATDTDIASALEYAVTLLPSDTNRRIILISDGKETSGDSAKVASLLAKQGVRIDAVYFETTYLDSAELQISDVSIPSDVYIGDEIDMTVTLESNVSADVVLTLYDGNEVIGIQDVTVTEGSNLFSFTVTATSAGVHTYRVGVTSENDTLSANNMMYSYVNVAGESTVLIIADDTDSVATLAEILSGDCAVTIVKPWAAPDTMVELCNYDEVILVNIDAEDLPNGFDALLESYAADFGRSVLMVGGDNTYMYGNMEGTLYEEMMPVQLSLTEDQSGGSVAVMLVLDCSMSMSQNATYLSIAKQGAIQSVNAMAENDYVGIISFNRSAYLKASLTQATDANKKTLTNTISALTTSQGTYYTQALQLAYQELMESDCAVKHVIFLSDGEPSDSGYTTVVKNMANDGITVSTIALGYSSSVLSSLAQTGGGRYYAVTSTSDLPDIMLTETEQVSVSSLITGEFIPVISSDSELTEGMSGTALPTIYGYLGVTIKEGAETLLATEEGNPLFAVWDYGIGRVASFMSDLTGNWSSELLASEVGQILTTRMVTTTVADAHNDSSLSVELAMGGNTTGLTVTTLSDVAGDTLALSVASPDGSSEIYSLTETAPGVFEGYIPTATAGVYNMTMVQYDADGNAVDYLEKSLAISYSAEYDAFAEDGDGLLAALCSFSDGIVSSDTDKLSKVDMKDILLVKSPLIPLGIIAAILAIIDIVIRMLRWKDVKDMLIRFKKRKLTNSK